jgi:excisionase family DNA binding protein
MNENGGVDECVSLSRAAEILDVCVRTVRREIDRGRLAEFRVGRSPRIRMSELRRYMEREPVGAQHI